MNKKYKITHNLFSLWRKEKVYTLEDFIPPKGDNGCARELCNGCAPFGGTLCNRAKAV